VGDPEVHFGLENVPKELADVAARMHERPLVLTREELAAVAEHAATEALSLARLEAAENEEARFQGIKHVAAGIAIGIAGNAGFQLIVHFTNHLAGLVASAATDDQAVDIERRRRAVLEAIAVPLSDEERRSANSYSAGERVLAAAEDTIMRSLLADERSRDVALGLSRGRGLEGDESDQLPLRLIARGMLMRLAEAGGNQALARG
jgi:hypothetical protein